MSHTISLGEQGTSNKLAFGAELFSKNNFYLGSKISVFEIHRHFYV